MYLHKFETVPKIVTRTAQLQVDISYFFYHVAGVLFLVQFNLTGL